MAWIRTVPEHEATGQLKREYDAAVKRAGHVFHILKVQSLTPRVLHAGIGLYQALMLADDSPLSRAEREAIATAVSHANHCLY